MFHTIGRMCYLNDTSNGKSFFHYLCKFNVIPNRMTIFDYSTKAIHEGRPNLL